MKQLAFLILWGFLGLALSPAGGQTVHTISAPFNASGGMAMPHPGRDLFIADFGENFQNPHGKNIYRLTPEGKVTVFSDQLLGVSGITFDSAKSLYLSLFITSAGIVTKIDPEGQISNFAAGNSFPMGLVVDEQGILAVANCGGAVNRFDTNGALIQAVYDSLFDCPIGIAYDAAGNLYVSNFNNGDILRLTPDGKTEVFASIPGNNNGYLTFANGKLYVTARSAHQIYSISSTGSVELLAGSGARGMVDGPVLTARFSWPTGIAASPEGDTLYVSDIAAESEDIWHPNVIRMIDLQALTGIEETSFEALRDFRLDPNFPNPFNPSTSIGYRLPKNSQVLLTIYNIRGQEVRILVNQKQAAGEKSVVWDGRDWLGREVSSGIYIYKMQAGNYVKSRKMMLLR